MWRYRQKLFTYIIILDALLAIDTEFDGNFEGLYNRLGDNDTTIGRVMSPDIHRSERRAILEFDISVIPNNASIEKANLCLGWYSGSNTSPRTNIYGFAGNGVLEATDVIQTNNLLAAALPDLWSVDVTSFIQNLVDNSDFYAGFLGIETRNGANRNYGYFSLTIDYVPEPATLLLLGFGTVMVRNGGTTRRKR